MAPDKIYITPGQIQDDELALYNYDDCVTYISKDALLEWARKAKNTECSTMESTRGYWCAINDLFDKLNSM